MIGIQQGRLWAIRNSENGPIFHQVENLLPLLFNTRKSANSYREWLKKQYDTNVIVVEVIIISKEVGDDNRKC